MSSQSPPFSLKSAFSPLMPPGAFGAAARYPFLQQQAKRFLSAPYSGTGYLPTVIQDSDPSDNGSINNGSGSATTDSQD